MHPAGFELEAEAQFVGGESAGSEARGEAIDEAREEKRERLQKVHGVFEFDLVVETERIFEREQLTVGFAAGQLAEMQALGSEALGDAEGRQCGEFLEAADAP